MYSRSIYNYKSLTNLSGMFLKDLIISDLQIGSVVQLETVYCAILRIKSLIFKGLYFICEYYNALLRSYTYKSLTNMLNIQPVFNRSKRLRADGLGKVHIRFIHKGRPFYFDTKILIKPDQWNSKKHIVVKHVEAFEYNDDIQTWMLEARKYYRSKWKARERFIPKDLIRHLQYDKFADVDFLAFSKEINESEKDQLADNTYKKRLDLFGKLEAYQEKIYCSQLSYDFVTDFKEWLFKQKSHKGTVLSANYIHSLFVVFKKFVNAARIKGYITEDIFYGFKISRVAKVVEVLSENELEIFYKYEADTRAKERAHKILCFLFFTGIRVGDLEIVKRDSFKANGLLEFVAGKTRKRKGKLARVPMHLFDDRAKEIFKKYGPFKVPNNYDLNTRFREILTDLKIKKYMTVHGARHTFKSMMLERGYPLHIIAEMMAHSSTSTTAKYGSVSDNAILKKINQ